VEACVLIRSEEALEGKQGLEYFHGVSAESAGSRALCLHRVTIPPGRRAKAHLHEGHESALFILSGEAEMWFGERLEHRVVCRPGDYLYIPAGVAHLPANLSETEPCVAVVARTDPRRQESVVLLPELDELV
jgi:uncharacterized RmlC-like cupin family protein